MSLIIPQFQTNGILQVLESDLAKIYWKKAEAAKISLMSGAFQSRINSQSYDNSLQIAEKSIQRVHNTLLRFKSTKTKEELSYVL